MLHELCRHYESVPGTAKLVARRLNRDERAESFEEPPYIANDGFIAMERGKVVVPFDVFRALVEKAGLPMTFGRDAAWQESFLATMNGASLKDRSAEFLAARYGGEAPACWAKLVHDTRVESRDRNFLDNHEDQPDVLRTFRRGERRRGKDVSEFQPSCSSAELQTLAYEIPVRTTGLRKQIALDFTAAAYNGMVGVERLLIAELKHLARDSDEQARIVEAADYLGAIKKGVDGYGNELELRKLRERRDALFKGEGRSTHTEDYLAELQLLFADVTRDELTFALRKAVATDPRVFER